MKNFQLPSVRIAKYVVGEGGRVGKKSELLREFM